MKTFIKKLIAIFGLTFIPFFYIGFLITGDHIPLKEMFRSYYYFYFKNENK